jgi:diguanylate cyclase (GGDEF)-like protein
VFGEGVRPSIAFSGEVDTGSLQKTRQTRESPCRLAALEGRLRQALRIWSGQHPDRPARMTRGEPAVLRVIAPLALIILVATVICTGFGYILARQADDYHEAERRQSLAAAVEALRAVSPDRVRGDADSVQVLERMSGLKGLRFETEPVRGDREVHSLLDHKGRILGWFSWEPERPASAMMMRLLPLAALIALALAGFAALAMWQLSRLGQLLARSEQYVQKLEYLDVLTGLPNHNHFFELFDQALAKRYGMETLAFATLDLDGFDEVNDALGYAGGDEVLAELGNRLRDALAPSAVIARLGSDEFVLMITGRNADSAPFILDTVRQALGQPIFLSQAVQNQAIQIKVSAGLAMAPRDGVTRDELTRRADLALRAAKRRHRGTTVVFAAEMEAELQERRFIKREVASALAAHAFDVYYQPIVRADGGAIAGVEALLRWNHPERGAIPPSEFVPVAEEAGLMDRLGEFVLRRAVADAACWNDVYVSVNVSPVQVRDRAFVDLVSAVLRESELEPSRLMLEMTEGVLIDNPEQTTERLLELRALGVRLALDDFGSGYSSLSYLQKLPFDKLKVDRSFVTALDRSANGGVIIQAIVTLGRALGMGVVIEGVETEEQRVLLRLAGCNEMQGFLFAKPTPRDEIGRLLTQTSSVPAARTHLRAVV